MPQQKKKKQEEQLPPGFIDPRKMTAPTPTEEQLPAGFVDINKKEEELPPGFIDLRGKSPQQAVDDIVKENIKKDILGLPGVQKTISTLTPAFDVLARGQYASARFADALADESKGILDAISEGFNELLPAKWAYEKQLKPSYSDVIRRRFPEFAADHPTASQLIGFVGDVALDPTSYLGIGVAKSGITVGSKVLTNPTAKVFVEGLQQASVKAFVGKKGTIDLVRAFPKAVEKAEKTKGVIEKKIAKAEAKGIDTVLVSQGQADRILTRLNIESELKKQGYFQAVRNKQDEIEKFLNNLSGSPNIELAKTIAKDETLADLKRFGKERWSDELFRDEVKERIEQRITTLASTSPELQKKFFEGRAIRLKFGVPFGKQHDMFKIMGVESIIRKFDSLTAYMEATGAKLSKQGMKPGLVNQLTGIAGRAIEAPIMLGRLVSRDFTLPQEYIARRNELQDYLQYAVGQTERDTLKLFTVNPESRERIGTAMSWIDDQTRNLEQLRPLGVGDQEYAQVFQRGMQRFKLDDKEIAIAGQLRQDYAELARIENEVGLLKSNLINYSPRGYEVIGDPDDFSLITRGKYGKSDVPQPYLSSSQQRKFLTNAEAEAAGLVPELDAAILYAHRTLQSRRAVAIKQFRDSIEEMFGTTTNRGKVEHTGILPTKYTPGPIPQKIIDDMKMIGEAVYPSGMSESAKWWLNFYDRVMLRPLKLVQTVVRPAFAAKQLISNTFQSALVAGAKAFKAFDPRVFLDAGLLLSKRGKDFDAVPLFLDNFISKHFTGNEGLDGILASRVVLSKIIGDEALMNFAKQYKLRTSLGEVYTGEEIVQLARENAIIRELDATGEQFSNKIFSGLLKDKQTYKNVAKEMSKFWRHAALVEDYSRMALFINGIRMGHTAERSAKIVNKALFDYQRGLSKIEQSLAKRVIPYYSFQRFALPFIFKQTLKQPGNPATMEKVLRTMEKLFVTGETLNDSEQNVFNEKGNNFVLEQGRQLMGFDRNGTGTVNILNNLTPFDMYNFFVFNEDGSLDYKRTTEKSIYGALVPYIKMPISAWFDKDLFTDKTIEQASKLGNVEGSIGQILPDWAKDAIGWENRYNAATGKTQVYASPFFAYYTMQMFPPLRDFIKGNEDVNFENGNSVVNALFASMNAIAEMSIPVKSQKFNLKEMDEFSVLKTRKEVNELREKIYGAYVRGSYKDAVGREADAEKADKELELLIQTFSENSKIRAENKLRGLGLGTDINQFPKGTVVDQPMSDQQKEFK